MNRLALALVAALACGSAAAETIRTDYYLPIVNARAADGSAWRTSLTIGNMTGRTVKFTVTRLNGDVFLSSAVDHGQSFFSPDVLGDAGLSGNYALGLHLSCDSCNLGAVGIAARVYSNTRASTVPPLKYWSFSDRLIVLPDATSRKRLFLAGCWGAVAVFGSEGMLGYVEPGCAPLPEMTIHFPIPASATMVYVGAIVPQPGWQIVPLQLAWVSTSGELGQELWP